MHDTSWVSHHEKAEMGGCFSAQFSGMIIFSIELYYGDQLCSKCITKSFVSYWKMYKMDRSSLKIVPCLATGGGGFSASWKLHKMDRSSLNFFLFLATGGGAFLPAEPKLLDIA